MPVSAARILNGQGFKTKKKGPKLKFGKYERGVEYPWFIQVHEWLSEAEGSTAETKYREESIEDYRFYAGDQDTAEVRDKLAEQNRPDTVFNEIKPKIDMLVGLGAQSKSSIEVVPVGLEDEPMAELMSGTLRHFHRKLKLGRKEISCFEHACKSGRSLLYFHVDKANPFRPQIKASRIPGYRFLLDPQGLEYDLSDHRFIFIEKWISEKDLKFFMPGIDMSLMQEATGLRYGDRPVFYSEATGMYRVVECWYWDYEVVNWFINPLSGKDESLPPQQFAQFTRALRQGVPLNPVDPEGSLYRLNEDVPFVQGYDKVYKYCLFSGDYIIEYGDSPYRFKGFPAVLFGAYKNEDENRWFSAVNMMKDPQRALNTMRRQLSHLLQVLPKGLLAAETGAIINIDEYEERSADPTFWLEVAKGKIDKFKFEKQPPISPVYDQYAAQMSESMKATSGIVSPLMGIQQSSREAGVTERLRQEAGMAVLYTLYDNLGASREQEYHILMNMVQQFVKLPEVVRIQGASGQQLIQINSQINPQAEGFNDITLGEYDLVAQESPDTATLRMVTAELLTEFNRNNPDTIPPDVLLNFVELPFTLKQQVRDHWEAQQEAARLEAEREYELRKEELDIKRAAANKPNTQGGN